MTDVSLRIKVDSAETDKGKKSLDDLAKAGAQAEASGKGLTQQTDRLSTAAKAAQAAFTALVGSMAVRKVIEYADEWQNAENRLKLVTSSAEDLTRVQGVLLQAANQTRAGFSSTAELFTTLTRSTYELGLSQSEVVAITKTINQTFAISGASAMAMDGAIRQLSQGLASGALRGDEFNAIAENSPLILDAVAESLNMARGDLREFAAQGGITSEVLVKALQEYADTAEKMAATATRTFGQSMTEARNNMVAFVGSSDAVKGATQGAGDAIVALSKNLETLGNVAAVAAIAYGSKMAGAAVTSTAALISSTAATSAAMAAEVVRTQALVASTAAEAARTAALIAGNSAMFTSATAITAAQAAQIAHTQALAANASAVSAATAANGAWRASLLALFGPGAIIGIAAAAMYAMVQIQKASAEEADRQSVAFDGVLASLGKLTEVELARAIQAEFEHVESLKRSRDQLDRASDGSAAFEEKIRKLNVQIDAAESNHGLLVRQLERVQSGWKPVTEETENATEAFGENEIALYYASIEAAKFWEWMQKLPAVQDSAATATDEVATRVSRLTEAQREANLTNQDAADSIDDLVEGMTAQGEASREVSQVMTLMRDDVSSAFADMLMSGENAFDAIAKSFERMVYKMVADWAAAGIMNMVGSAFGKQGLGGTSTLGTLLGGSGGSGKPSAGNVISGAKNAGAIAAGASGAASVFGTSGAVISAAEYGMLTGGATVGTAGGLGAGLAAGIKGAGSSIMGALGSIPGWGWALAGGAALAGILSDKATPSTNAGMLLHDVPGAAADRKFDVAPFESGFQPVGFARRENQGAASEVIDTFRAYDAALTEMAESLGMSVNFNNNTFRPLGASETGRGDGVFVGLAGEDGTSNSRPLDQQLTEYVKLFIDGLGGQINPGAKSAILSAGNADAMLAKAAELVGINGSHANGLNYVPFDGYRAELHKGERVMPANEARAMDSGWGKMAAELSGMRAALMETAMATRRTADLLLRVTRDGESLVTVAA